ncbi:MAG: small basic protein [Candidatus Omnitrophica bacterium]|nr:small basic protein [Candidatus Omnitrophota bacterium]
MSQHSSLRVDSVGVKHRNVLKRFERVNKMQDEKKFAEGRSVYGLPKIKSMKVKVKKGGGGEKAEAAAEGAAAKGAAPAKAAAPAAKAAAPAAKPKK